MTERCEICNGEMAGACCECSSLVCKKHMRTDPVTKEDWCVNCWGWESSVRRRRKEKVRALAAEDQKLARWKDATKARKSS